MTLKRKIISFISLFLIVHVLLYCLNNYISSKKNELFIQLSNYKTAPKCKILFMGDSHVVRAVDLSVIDSSCTLAYFSENIIMNYYKLKYCITNHLPKPQYVILPCDIGNLSTGFSNHFSNKPFYYSLIPLSEVKYLNSFSIISYYDYFKIKLFPYSEWQFAFNEFNDDRETKAKYKYSEWTINKQKKDAKRLIQKELLEGGLQKNLYSENGLLFFQKYIKLCKDNNIKLIFVKFPLTKVIFNELKYNIDSIYIYNRPSENIINKNKIPILNFEYLFINNPELFFDSHHLNTAGKNKFTIILKQKLDSLYKIY